MSKSYKKLKELRVVGIAVRCPGPLMMIRTCAHTVVLADTSVPLV